MYMDKIYMDKIKTFIKYKLLGLFLILMGLFMICVCGIPNNINIYEENTVFLELLFIGLMVFLFGVNEFQIASIDQKIDEKILSLYKELEVKKR